MIMNFVPRGISPGQTQTRFASTKPSSYNSERRTVDAVISMGSPVVRFYGTISAWHLSSFRLGKSCRPRAFCGTIGAGA